MDHVNWLVQRRWLEIIFYSVKCLGHKEIQYVLWQRLAEIYFIVDNFQFMVNTCFLPRHVLPSAIAVACLSHRLFSYSQH